MKNEKEILELFKQYLMNNVIYKPAMVVNLMDRLVFGYINKVISESDNHFIVESTNAPYNKVPTQRLYRFDLAPSATQEGFKKIISISQISS